MTAALSSCSERPRAGHPMAGPAVGQPPTGAPGKKVSINQRVKSKVPVQGPVQGPVQAPVLDQPTPKTSKVNEKVDGKLVIRNKARKRNLNFRKKSCNPLAVSEPVNSPAKRIKVQYCRSLIYSGNPRGRPAGGWRGHGRGHRARPGGWGGWTAFTLSLPTRGCTENAQTMAAISL